MVVLRLLSVAIASSSLATYRFHRHGGAIGLCVADLGTAIPAGFLSLTYARCAANSLVAGWV